jgi:uncharacterized protein YaaN involved in tellurite resistance
LIETIEDSLRIQAEGRKQRQAAEIALEKMRDDIQAKLAALPPRTPGVDGHAQ